MATTFQVEEHVSLKLLLNEKGNKVLFAEAGKDFVDILCSFLTMPLGTISRLVEKDSNMGPVTVGCLNSLYKSVADLDEGCMSTEAIKQMLLQPINSAEDYCSTLKINIDDNQPTKYFTCSNFNTCFYRDMITSLYKDKYKCRCSRSFTLPVFLKPLPEGFVNGIATYVITDDLIVMPNCIDYTSFSLYAQGQQDFANLLLSFLTYPLGGIVSIFGGNCSLGSINGLYNSIVDLDENQYLTSSDAKNRLVDPCIAPQLKLSKQILPILEPRGHGCYGYCGSYVNSNNVIHFRNCKSIEYYDMKLNLSNVMIAGDGYVKGPAMYFATDDLVVAPLTPISALGLLNRLKTPLNDLKEKVVTIGIKECLSILKASLTSTSALTNGLAHMLTQVKEEK